MAERQKRTEPESRKVKVALTAVALVLCGVSQVSVAQDIGAASKGPDIGTTPDVGTIIVPNAAPNQWFTGSLEAPSPSLPKAGMLAVEPYVIYQTTSGMYGDDGARQAIVGKTQTLEALLVIKYAITNQLTIEALPSFSRSWAGQVTSTGAGFGDLPLELEYRVKDGNYHNGSPSITFDLGITLPTGEYDRLGTALNGTGQGAYVLKQGVVLQSLFDTWGNHPVRIRVYGSAYEPLSQPSVNDVSVYRTAQGFTGRARVGVSGQAGIGAGWALDQRWVFAFDMVHNVSDPYRLNGTDGLGNAVHISGLHQTGTAIAPAIEYNWSANAGLIAGVEWTVAGQNTASYVAPQIAVAVSF